MGGGAQRWSLMDARRRSQASPRATASPFRSELWCSGVRVRCSDNNRGIIITESGGISERFIVLVELKGPFVLKENSM